MKEESSLSPADTEQLKMSLSPSSVFHAFIMGLTFPAGLLEELGNLSIYSIYTTKWQLKHLIKATMLTAVGITGPHLRGGG